MAEIRYARVQNMHTSFTRTGDRVIRFGSGRGTVYRDSHTVQLVPPGGGKTGWQHADVYKVQISPDLKKRWPHQPESYHVVALSDKAVSDYVKRRYGNIASRNMGLAAYVETIAMRKLSTRPPAAGTIGKRAQQIGDEWVEVFVKGGDLDCVVRVRDNLTYAAEAIKGGEGAIETALRSAANRINGMIRHKIGAGLEKSWATPFPEVKR